MGWKNPPKNFHFSFLDVFSWKPNPLLFSTENPRSQPKNPNLHSTFHLLMRCFGWMIFVWLPQTSTKKILTKNPWVGTLIVDGSEIRRSPVEVGSCFPMIYRTFFHPGGYVAGFLKNQQYHPWKINMEPTNHPFLSRKMIWTKPPWGHVPAVNLQGCSSSLGRWDSRSQTTFGSSLAYCWCLRSFESGGSVWSGLVVAVGGGSWGWEAVWMAQGL